MHVYSMYSYVFVCVISVFVCLYVFACVHMFVCVVCLYLSVCGWGLYIVWRASVSVCVWCVSTCACVALGLLGEWQRRCAANPGASAAVSAGLSLPRA